MTIRYSVTVRTQATDDIVLQGHIDGKPLVEALASTLPADVIMLVSVATDQPDGNLAAGAVRPTGTITEKDMPDGSTITVGTGFEEQP